jgi:hypothetical protein
MLVEKKVSGNIRVCTDFRNLNRATRKDEHRVISFLNGNASYNHFSWSRKTCTKQLLDVQILLVYSSGLS